MILETIGPNGAVTHCNEVDELPEDVSLGLWHDAGDGFEAAAGTAPAYLGDKRCGRVEIRVLRHQGSHGAR